MPWFYQMYVCVKGNNVFKILLFSLWLPFPAITIKHLNNIYLLKIEDGDAPPPTKRRLRGAVAAPAAEIKVESSTQEPPTAPSKQKSEPSNCTKQSGAPATAVAAPQRKFFKSKAASSSVKIEPKKNEEATSLFKKECVICKIKRLRSLYYK